MVAEIIMDQIIIIMRFNELTSFSQDFDISDTWYLIQIKMLTSKWVSSLKLNFDFIEQYKDICILKYFRQTKLFFIQT